MSELPFTRAHDGSQIGDEVLHFTVIEKCNMPGCVNLRAPWHRGLWAKHCSQKCRIRHRLYLAGEWWKSLKLFFEKCSRCAAVIIEDRIGDFHFDHALMKLSEPSKLGRHAYTDAGKAKALGEILKTDFVCKTCHLKRRRVPNSVDLMQIFNERIRLVAVISKEGLPVELEYIVRHVMRREPFFKAGEFK